MVISIVVTMLVVTGVIAGLAGDDDAAPPGWAVPSAPAPPPATPAPLDAPEPTPSPTPSPAPALNLNAEVDVEVDGFFSWAALDRRTGERAGSRNQARTSSTESMIKVWIVADYLRRRTEAGKEPSKRRLREAELAIRDSHNGTTESLYRAGGTNDVVERMIDMCGLTDTEIYPYWWSRTEISARDAVRLGECIADGTAAGPEWTDWVLEQMRKVRGTTDPEDQPMPNGGEGGRWGIIDGLPPEVREAGVAIKNGWTAIGRTNSWHISCLAITDDWVMAVLMRYPISEGLEYGAERCAEVARQLVPSPVPRDHLAPPRLP
ncbi:MAG TPA: hypothetical protein VKZ74_05960 [Natronosporangium sp.]|nr:hypothetical protein [Natronosporangium sp.]